MILAGSLKYNLVFFEMRTVQSDSGAFSKTRVQLFKCKAAKVKSTGNYKVENKELFHTNELIFKIRGNKLLTEKLIVEYDNKEYSISFIDKNLFDNTVNITLEKLNK